MQAKEFEAEAIRLEELKKQLSVIKEIEESRRISDAQILEGGKISGATGTGGVVVGEGKSAELKAIEDSFLNESELLIQKYERDKEILDREVTDIETRNELKVKLEQQHKDNIQKIQDTADAKVLKEKSKIKKDEDKLAKLKDKQSKDNASNEEKIMKGSRFLLELPRYPLFF